MLVVEIADKTFNDNHDKEVNLLDEYLKKHKIEHEVAECKEWAGDYTYYVTRYEINIDVESKTGIALVKFLKKHNL